MHRLYWGGILYWRNLHFSLFYRINLFCRWEWDSQKVIWKCPKKKKLIQKKPPNLKKPKVFGTSSPEVRETLGNVESNDFWVWLVPFITTRKTKSDVRVKVALSKCITINTRNSCNLFFLDCQVPITRINFSS